jgi:N utilization substance protein B
VSEIDELGYCDILNDEQVEKYAIRLFDGVLSNIEDIDALIQDAAENWKISRMPITDRSILRVAVFELKYLTEVPLGVVINEAVEIAEGFGAEDDSYKFINGVLAKISQQVRAVSLETIVSPEVTENTFTGDLR